MESKRKKYSFGKLLKTLAVAICLVPLASCALTPSPVVNETSANLRSFAMANCLDAFFEKQGWDNRDIRGIAGGYVEMGNSEPDTYVEIAEAIRAWQPEIRTKHDLDIDLVKCFHLDENDAINATIENAGGG